MPVIIYCQNWDGFYLLVCSPRHFTGIFIQFFLVCVCVVDLFLCVFLLKNYSAKIRFQSIASSISSVNYVTKELPRQPLTLISTHWNSFWGLTLKLTAYFETAAKSGYSNKFMEKGNWKKSLYSRMKLWKALYIFIICSF